MRRFKAAEADGGVRADVFVAGKYPDFSRSSLENLFDAGNVKMGNEVLKPSHKLRPGEILQVADAPLFRKPSQIKLPVIYEDDDVLVINKPPGVLTHSKGALNTEASVASFIKNKISGFPKGSNRAGIVHRLDRGTSGVIITAKNPEALAWLQKQFSARKSQKMYEAVVEGTPEPGEAVIDAPIVRNSRKPQTFTISAAGKPSQTRYKVLKSFHKGDRAYSLLELEPFTGRTHQIRVHLAYIGHPVVGDRVYGRSNGEMLLHAKSLELTLPSRQTKIFKAPMRREFKEFVKGV